MGWKFPEIPRPRPIVHLHYLGHFGASVNQYESTYELIVVAPKIDRLFVIYYL